MARVVTRKIVAYSWAMVAASRLLVPIGHAGWVYLAAAAGLGGWFLTEAHRLHRRVRAGDRPKPMRLFHLSITHLTLLFAALAVGQLLR